MEPQSPTLDQLRVFLAIAETGSFAGAARRLNRATSVVSYQLANLEAQLALTLFERSTARRVELTDAGRAILPNARAVSGEIGAMLSRARSLVQGVEAELSFAVDVMFPTGVLTDILNDFRLTFPAVSLCLHVEAIGAVAQLVRDNVADLGISGPIPSAAEGLEFIPLCSIAMVPVAAPRHPLAALAHQDITTAQVYGHVQLVLTDRSKLSEGQSFGVLAADTWRLADLAAKHALLLAGVGWGGMPEPMVADDLACGRLVRLPIEFWKNARYQVRAVSRTDQSLGPAGAWLLNCLKQREAWA